MKPAITVDHERDAEGDLVTVRIRAPGAFIEATDTPQELAALFAQLAWTIVQGGADVYVLSLTQNGRLFQ